MLSGRGGIANTPLDDIESHLGIIGWRKKCLYVLLIILMLLIITNLVLTLWILKVMEFSTVSFVSLHPLPPFHKIA